MRLPALDRRRAGVLLHLSCLPGALGANGRRFIDWLAQGGYSVWQILPAGPTGADGSPYWVRSDFAGNPAFLDAAEMPEAAGPPYDHFRERSAHWLEDYALFEALSTAHAGAPFWVWPEPLRDRHPDALAGFADSHAAAIETVRRTQFAFDTQWRRLLDHAHARGVRLFGDLPFYVAPDSAEVWAHREQFQLFPSGQPRAVAGVPPDYFSATGQLWGNPLYDWSAQRQQGFQLWRARVRAQLERVDLLRIDHFRALAAHWSVPAGAADARGGAWHPTPGAQLLQLLLDEFGSLPIVAEDLGIITDDVTALRKGFGLPGMRVLQFAFSGEGDNPHLPHMHEHDCVVYTGTHDNDTTVGWYGSLEPRVREQVDFFLGPGAGSMPDALLRLALGSVARLAVIPMQDLLGLGTESRLNTPGTVGRNWRWQMPMAALDTPLAEACAALNRIYGRRG